MKSWPTDDGRQVMTKTHMANWAKKDEDDRNLKSLILEDGRNFEYGIFLIFLNWSHLKAHQGRSKLCVKRANIYLNLCAISVTLIIGNIN